MKKITGLLGLVLIFVLTLGGGRAEASGDMIHTGVYIDGIQVSGMTKSEAQTALETYEQELGAENLTLQIGDHQLTVTLGELGLSYTNPEVVDEALMLGKTGNIIQRYKDRKDLEHENKNYILTWAVNEALVREYVTNECTQFDQEAVNGSLTHANGAFSYVAGEEGVLLDVDGSVDTIVNFIENEWDHTNGVVTLPVEIDEPRGTAEELSRVQDVLGTFTTSYSTSSANRSQNISNGAALINGTVLYPGETFSAYETVSPFTEANGYRMAGSYLNGKVVDSLGGGICQVSTTLYNAVIRAELDVEERSGHSMLVSYVNPAADAAIAGTYKDLKFTNSTDAPIYIEAYTANKTVTFTIYGEEYRPSNRTISFESVTLSTTDAGTVLVADGGQPIGYRGVESGHTGCVAELYKHVYVDGVETEKVKLNKTSYQASARIVTIGVAGDENMSNQLQAAIALQDEAQVNALLGI